MPAIGKGNNRRLSNITSALLRYITRELSSLFALSQGATLSVSPKEGGNRNRLDPSRTIRNILRLLESLVNVGYRQRHPELQAFISAMHGRSQFWHVDNLRCFMLQEKCDYEEKFNVNISIALSANF